MTHSELKTQLLEALETGLDCARDVLNEVMANPMTKIRPMRLTMAERDVQQIEEAIELVGVWL